MSQPKPIQNTTEPTFEVLKRLVDRKAEAGRLKYGVALQPLNGRCSLVDLLEELVDGSKYALNEIRNQREILRKLFRWSTDLAVVENPGAKPIQQGIEELFIALGGWAALFAYDELLNFSPKPPSSASENHANDEQPIEDAGPFAVMSFEVAELHLLGMELGNVDPHGTRDRMALDLGQTAIRLLRWLRADLMATGNGLTADEIADKFRSIDEFEKLRGRRPVIATDAVLGDFADVGKMVDVPRRYGMTEQVPSAAASSERQTGGNSTAPQISSLHKAAGSPPAEIESITTTATSPGSVLRAVVLETGLMRYVDVHNTEDAEFEETAALYEARRQAVLGTVANDATVEPLPEIESITTTGSQDLETALDEMAREIIQSNAAAALPKNEEGVADGR